jgi:hypothetical protein
MKRKVGRPKKPESEKAKFTTRAVAFSGDNFEKLDEMRGHESVASFINRLVADEYLRV